MTWSFCSPSGAAPLIAYRLVFGFLAVCLVIAALVYSRINDTPPSRDGV